MSDSGERRDGEKEERLPRRAVLRGGLASFAAALMSRTLPGCGPGLAADAGMDGGGQPDLDAGRDGGPVDAGPVYFPPRDIPAPPALVSRIADLGPLSADPDANGLRLPPGFTSRVVAKTGELVEGTDYMWHVFPDGGACFLTEDGGWIYTSNSEMLAVGRASGGVSALRFDASGDIVSAKGILTGTNVNCAGGLTPWHTWLSCEEVVRGQVWETDPWGEHPAVARPALGVFKHEAVAVDPVNGHLYLTEDESDGCFYRFVPDALTPEGHPDLHAGRLEVAEVAADGAVTWHALPDPQFQGSEPCNAQVAAATHFSGGEGIWYHAGVIYFSTKGDHHVRAYRVADARIDVIYDGSDTAGLHGVDNLTVSCCGDVLVAEDGGTMQVVAVLPDGTLKPIVQVIGHDGSEVTGPAFDPSGTRLYFSSQRGPGGGWTFEVTGPFHEPMP